jgi:hypothetical protein
MWGLMLLVNIKKQSQACNSSYSESRDQKECGSKPALAKYFAKPCLENTQQGACGMAQMVEHLP